MKKLQKVISVISVILVVILSITTIHLQGRVTNYDERILEQVMIKFDSLDKGMKSKDDSLSRVYLNLNTTNLLEECLSLYDWNNSGIDRGIIFDLVADIRNLYRYDRFGISDEKALQLRKNMQPYCSIMAKPGNREGMSYSARFKHNLKLLNDTIKAEDYADRSSFQYNHDVLTELIS